MARQAIVDTAPDDPLVAQLVKTTRWHERFLPVRSAAAGAKGRRGGRKAATNSDAQTGLYIASLYAKANADNSDLVRKAAAAAARVGDAPYFLCMDANINTNDSPPLLDALQNGWANVADGCPDARAPTYATNKD